MFAQIQILNMVVFQHKHKKKNSKLFKSLIIETSMLPLYFDELIQNLKNCSTMKVSNK
jgi:hypothetical protein